jgi:hypothetical protein
VSRRNGDANLGREPLKRCGPGAEKRFKFRGQVIGHNLDLVSRAKEFLERTGTNQTTAVDDDGTVADLFDLRENVRAKENCFTRGFQVVNEIFHFQASRGIEARGWFVKDE